MRTDFDGRFKDLKIILKPSFGFLEYPFALDVVENGRPALKPVLTDTAALNF